jgi:predicted transcriptional regulator of viral defense system
MQTMRDQIVARINRLGQGKAFSAKDFLDIESRTTVDVALAGLTKKGKIRRIRRGLYDMPKFNAALGGKLSPDIDEAARAIARRQRWKIVPEGSWAANLLGLSAQVPSKYALVAATFCGELMTMSPYSQPCRAASRLPPKEYT